MKISENNNEIETSLNNSKNFTIKASPKAFKILSSGLYSNKIRAIIRELSCNAYDAHIAANNPEPFIVHLPSRLDNSFYVKDFGTGLSEEDIMSLYTTYFDSNKTNSNDFVGALGLGSKSPFSYTDSFIVESRFNGRKTLYLIYLDENEFPSISKIEESDTDEHSGLTVKFSIKENDFKDFTDEAVFVLSPFEIRPKIVGSYDNIKLHSKLEFINDYCLNSNEYRYFGLHAFMGNILYPVNLKELDLQENIIQFLKKRNIIIKFNIGDLDITPSREQLSYIKSTKEALVKKINSTIDNIINKYAIDINSSEDTFSMIQSFNSLFDDIRAIIYHKIDRDKFQFDDKLYSKDHNRFYCNLGHIVKSDIKLDGIKSFKVVETERRTKSKLPYLTKVNCNLFNIPKNKSFYISFNKEDDNKFKLSEIFYSYLISVSTYKNSNITDDDIIRYIKDNYFITNILYAKDLVPEEEEVDQDRPLMYLNDMSYGNTHDLNSYLQPYTQIQFSEYKGFDSVEEIKNDNRTFLIACDKSNILKKDGSKLINNDAESKYYKFIYSIFTKYYPSYKLLFCRKKAIKYVEEKFKIPYFFDFAERLLRKQKHIRDQIIDMYKDVEEDNSLLEKVSKSLDATKLENINDNKLKNIILKYRSSNYDKFKNRYAINRENICRLYKNVKITNENISNNDYIRMYDSVFHLACNLWTSDIRHQSQNIIDLANLIYERNQANV